MGAGVRRVVGLVLIVLGTLGMLLPLMPGTPLALAGLALLGWDRPILRRLREWWARWRAHPEGQGRRPAQRGTGPPDPSH